MPAASQFDHITGNIHDKTNKRDKSRKNKSHYSGWQDGPFHYSKGEEALWRAVITQAMIDALNNNCKPEYMKYKREATRWLTSNSDDFLEVCVRAGLEPDYVRIRAKKAFADPYTWRTEAGESARYAERKAKREARKQKQNYTQQTEPHSTHIIQGPWKE